MTAQRVGTWLPLLLSALVGRLAAQELWELEPYRIGLVVVADRSPEWQTAPPTELAEAIRARLLAVVGGAWELTPLEAEAALAARFNEAVREPFPDEALFEALPREWRRLDKLFVVAVAASGGGLELTVRDADLRVYAWSAPETRYVAQRSALPESAAAALLAAFAPLARIDAQEKQTLLHLQAGRLPIRDKNLAFLAPGDLLQPFVRTADRDGATRRVQPIPWTFLRAEQPLADGWTADVVSGLRGPLSSKRRGRAELLALRVRIPLGSTVLRLRSRTDPNRPLIGYEVFSVGKNPSETMLLGLSDQAGELTIEPADERLRSLVIKHGGLLLARLPLAPGWRREVTVPLPDDDLRLEYEGQLVGLQEEIVDHVARRGALVLQARARLDEGRVDEAKKIFERLRALPNRAEFASRLGLLRTQIAAADIKDPQTQARISQMLVDTEKVLNTFLLDGDLRELDQELRGK